MHLSAVSMVCFGLYFSLFVGAVERKPSVWLNVFVRQHRAYLSRFDTHSTLLHLWHTGLATAPIASGAALQRSLNWSLNSSHGMVGSWFIKGVEQRKGAEAEIALKWLLNKFSTQECCMTGTVMSVSADLQAQSEILHGTLATRRTSHLGGDICLPYSSAETSLIFVEWV